MFGQTVCPHCRATSWKIVTIEPIGGNFKQNVLQCNGCGAPVGVLDYYNLGGLLKEQEKEIASLKRELQSQASTLCNIQMLLRHMAR